MISFTGNAHCYFHPDWIGNYVLNIPHLRALDVQISEPAPVSLSKLSIEATAIPILGDCHRRVQRNFLLIER